MAINTHLIYGKPKERKAEFEALMNWINDRVNEDDKTYYPNFMLIRDFTSPQSHPKEALSKTDIGIFVLWPLIKNTKKKKHFTLLHLLVTSGSI